MERKYFSEWGQDKWVVEKIFDFQESRYFLDLAAGNGILVSNTYFLEKYLNWKGIYIEANDKSFEELKENRACICEHACVDNMRQKVKFTDSSYKHSYLGGIIDKDVDNTDEENKSFVWKQTVTLKEILEKHNAPNIIDYFSLDIEGAETRVMKDFPFNKYTFLSMSVERPGKLLRSIFKINGYLEVGSNLFDKLYVHESLVTTFCTKKKWRIYCCYYLRKFFNIFKIDRIIYYTRRRKEIPGMLKRKSIKLKNIIRRFIC